MRKTKLLLFATALLLGCNVLSATPHDLTRSNPTVSEDFNSMYDAGAGTLILPEGWVVDRNLRAPRTVGKWSEAGNSVMYEGGASLASNAKNGTWNFGSTADPTDRAIGGLTTTVDNGTRCINLMTSLRNNDADPVSGLNISYNIEKYRKGDNAAGFAVQLYFSTDGENWTNAGENFRTIFDSDNETLGAPEVPISTTAVTDKNLLADIASGNTLYLAWNISVASGTSPNKAPGLAIDDINITATYTAGDKHMLYIENATGKAGLSVYSTDSDFYGAKPGKTSTLTKIVNGVTYYAWDMPASDFELCATAGTYDFGPVNVSASADAYYCISNEALIKIDDPLTYTGWVDPNRPAFVASGYYLRGDINGWAALEDWEFSNEGNNTYVIYDKELSDTFKVADANWESFNYGSNGSNIMADTPYVMTAGTDSNISCGNYVYRCKRIVMTLQEGIATLLIETDDNEEGLTSVYMVGDFNSFNYMDTAGELKLDTTDNLFKGQVTMKGGADGLSHWLIYQRLGMGGAWGLASDASSSALAGNLVKGERGKAAVDPATYDVTFSLTDGSYTFTRVESSPSIMTLNPAEVVLTPVNPEAVKVLSLNNSLIHYNDQDFVFNDIAEAMGTNASWTKHTNLGKPLSYHWEEGEGTAADGTPGAKMMIRSDAWSHIILQEQSSLPRTNPETFRANVKQWIDYIRQYCPNPNAVIILPVNWAYSSDWDNFNSYNARFMEVYNDVAAELGCVVVPVAKAYDNMYTAEGATETCKMFSDDRHPTPKATYMAACLEYAAITGVDPINITYTPSDITAEEGDAMRKYASEAYKGYHNTVNHLQGTVDFKASLLDDFGIEYPLDDIKYTVDGGGSISPAGVFTADGTKGTYTVTAKSGEFEKKATVTVANHATEVIKYPAILLDNDNLSATEDFDGIGTDATATLPEAWRIDKQTVSLRTLGTFATALSETTYAGGVSLPSNAKNGLWNFGMDNDRNRALGGITTGVDNGTRAVNLYTHLLNDGTKTLEKVKISYDIEKYRIGNNPAGFAVQLYYSYDGRNWTNAGSQFYTKFEPDAATAGYAEVPGEVIGVSELLPINLTPGLDVYLAWNISVASGDAANGAMALAIDNFSVEASLPEVPVCKHYIYVDNQTSWDALGLYAWGDSELFGAWPGQAPIDEIDINGIHYTVFGLDTDGGNYSLIFNNWNNNKQLADYPITADKDYFLSIDDNSAKEITQTSVNSAVADDETISFDGTTLRTSAEWMWVYNTSGMQVASSGQGELNIAPFPAGVYIVKTGKRVLKIVM